ncbi:MAG: hypothetical protein P8M16_07095 [Acidimicrobiales bacterium]|nr:hypothetical protein [Acidimicrobiales bacterium]
MSTVLSIHLGVSAVHAAVSVDGRIDVLALADSQASVDAPDLTDVRGVVLILVEAYARCLKIVDAVPNELILIRSDGAGVLDPVLVEAARRSRVPDPVVLDEMRAVAALAAHGPPGVSRELAPVLGGIFWRRSGDAPTGPKPIVTRADLGRDSTRADRTPPAPSVVAVGPRTVFEETRASARHRWGFSLPLVVVVLGLVGTLVLLQSDERPIAPPPDLLTTTSLPTPTTVSSSAAALPVVPPTTVLPTTTSSSLMLPATSLTVPDEQVALPEEEVSEPDVGGTETLGGSEEAPDVDVTTTTEVPRLGTVTLSGIGLTLDATSDNEVLVGFGDGAETAVVQLAGVLGEPVGDTGWVEDESCLAAEVRRLGWGGLELVLARDSVDGQGQLVQWFLDGPDSTETSWWTLERIGIGSTVADLRDAYGPRLFLEQPSDRDPAAWFDAEPVLGDGVLGAVGNITDTGRILLMWAGDGCLRRFS